MRFMFTFLMALVLVGCSSSTDEPKIEPSIDMILGDYKKITKEEREALVAEFVKNKGWAGEDVPLYVNCMGDFANSKSETLSFLEVIGWCNTEAKKSRKEFEAHFNELDAEDYGTMAEVQCQNFVKASLKSPSEADFPWLDRTRFYQGEWRYVIKSYVDAPNAYGTMLRTNWHCDIQYSGKGDTADIKTWTLHDLEILPQ